MCTDEPYENIPHHKFHNDNQSILVATYVKDIMLVSHIVNRAKRHPHFREGMPLCLLNGMIPTLKRYPCVLVPGLLVKFLQFSMRNDSHIVLPSAKLHKYSVNQNFLNNKFQFTEYLKSQSRDLQEAERYADVTEAVWLTVVLLEIVVGEFSAPDEVITTTERKFDLESIRLGFDLHQAAGLP